MKQLLKQSADILMLWPVLTLLSLQITLAIYLDEAALYSAGLFVAIFCILLAVHIQTNAIRKFVTACVLTGISCAIYLTFQKPLAGTFFPKNAWYEAQIRESGLSGPDRTKAIADLKQRLQPLKENISGRVLLTIEGRCKLPEDSLIRFFSKIKPPTAYVNPGVFDYQKYLQRKNIWAKAYVPDCGKIKIIEDIKPSLRERLRARILDPLLNDQRLENGPVLTALILGTRSLSTSQKQLIRDSGISHLFAISGTHFGIMTGLIYLMIILVLNRFPEIYLKTPRQKIAAVLCLIFIGFYLFVVSHQPSLIRSGTMMALYFLSVILERQRNLLHIILVSAAFILFFDPVEIFNPSFQLSFLCVLILCVVYQPIHHRLKKTRLFTRLPRFFLYFIEIVIVSWLLQIMLAPLVIFEFGIVPVSGFINNLWAVPYFQFIVIPLSLMYFFTSLILPALASHAALIWDVSVRYFFSFLQWANSFDWPSYQSHLPHLAHVLLTYGMVFWFFLTRKKILLFAHLALLLICLSLTWHEHHLKYDLKITQLDVGQGDAILVQTRHKNILIDAGGHAYIDIGNNVLLPYLRHTWVDRLDGVIITHQDLDHYGGLMTLMDHLRIGNIWINSDPARDTGFKTLLEKATAKNITISVIGQEQNIQIDRHTALRILDPRLTQDLSDNDRSLVAKLTHKNFTALFTGDISKKAEELYVQKYGSDLQADLLKVAHHGSHSSSSRLFLNAVKPRYALIGAGRGSRFGHPHESTLERLRQKDVEILRTDTNGAVGVRVVGERIKTWRYRDQ